MKGKRLYRSQEGRVLGGVLGGLAEYFDHDPTIWRLGFALLIVLTGLMPGLLFYVIGYFLMPADEQPEVTYRVVEE